MKKKANKLKRMGKVDLKEYLDSFPLKLFFYEKLGMIVWIMVNNRINDYLYDYP